MATERRRLSFWEKCILYYGLARSRTLCPSPYIAISTHHYGSSEQLHHRIHHRPLPRSQAAYEDPQPPCLPCFQPPIHRLHDSKSSFSLPFPLRNQANQSATRFRHPLCKTLCPPAPLPTTLSKPPARSLSAANPSPRACNATG